MRSRSTWSVATAIAALCFLTVVLAECPNGCSGNGDCMAKDMCNCYKNFQGNDCADRTCLFGRAHVDTPKGDINMDKSRSTGGWILANSQQHPSQTYEYFNPDAVNDEAHFYMECSNKGICDRSTGLCQCFDGYEGNGCRRTTCPGKCSGHGTCESVRELGRKNAGTLFGLEGSTGAVLYNLWDSNSTYGCRCDPWYFGPDCNKRSCKVGVDPLYLSVGNPRYETFVVHAYAATGTALTGAYIRLRLWDYYGESYITNKISILNDQDATAATATANGIANALAVATAIKAVPNLTFKQVKCEPMGTGSDLPGIKSLRGTNDGLSVTCQYTGNPGRMRIPEIAAQAVVTTASVVTTAVQGQDEDWFTYKSSFVVNTVVGTAVTLTAASPDPLGLVGKLIKIGPYIVSVNARTGTVAPWGLTLDYALNQVIGTSTPIFTADPATLVTVTAGTALSVALDVGSDKMTFAAAPSFATGDLLFFHNAFFYVQELTDNSVPAVLADTSVTPNVPAAAAVPATVWYARIHKPFGGMADTGAASGTTAPFKVTKGAALAPFQYVSECAGRGMCGYDTGVCTCFKGYTNDNCDTQNILAL